MKQYFSTDSTIFVFVSIMLIVLGNSEPLTVWLILSAVFIVFKAKLTLKQIEYIAPWFIFGGVFGLLFFGTSGILAVAIGSWAYVIYQRYLV